MTAEKVVSLGNTSVDLIYCLNFADVVHIIQAMEVNRMLKVMQVEFLGPLNLITKIGGVEMNLGVNRKDLSEEHKEVEEKGKQTADTNAVL